MAAEHAVKLETALAQFGQVDVILLVNRPTEFEAVLNRFLLPFQERATVLLDNCHVAQFGCKVNNLNCVVVMNPMMSAHQQNKVVDVVVRNLKPKAIISIGVGWGHEALVKEKGGELTDVIVSQSILDCSNYSTKDKGHRFLERGPRQEASKILVDLFSRVVTESNAWTFKRLDGTFAKAFIGETVALYLSKEEYGLFFESFPMVYGGNMEALGLYKALDATRYDKDLACSGIAVNGILDWGLFKEDGGQLSASCAKTSVDLVYTTLCQPNVHILLHEGELFAKAYNIVSRNGIVGISGMFGIGKTTLAKKMYHRLSKDFLGCQGYVSFDLPYSKADTDIKLLHLSTTCCGLAKQNSNDIDVGLRQYFFGKKVLLLFDNVSNEDQVERLRSICVDVDPGSYILFTSRQSSLFRTKELLELGLLSNFAAYEFLCESADLVGPEVHVEGTLQKAIENAANACGGLPLTLKLVGRHMRRDTNVQQWQRLKILQSEEGGSLRAILEDSLNLLTSSGKVNAVHMFFDVACICANLPKHLLVAMWNSDPKYMMESEMLLDILEDASLIITVVKNDVEVITIEESLRALGREMVIASGARTRLWSPHSYELLQDGEDLGSYTSIEIKEKGQVRDKDLLPPLVLGNRLQSLMLAGSFELSDNGELPSTLRWFQWPQCPLIIIPWATLKNLVYVDLSQGNITSVEGIQACTDIVYLDLSLCSDLEMTLPEKIGELKKLKMLDLTRWKKLKELPFSFGQLTNLQTLDFEDCESLMEFPSFGLLTNLQHLNFTGCTSLTALPSDFEKLINLQYLILTHCFRLKALPDKFGDLVNLKHLFLGWCKGLKTLPGTFGGLINLDSLDLGDLNMAELPLSFGSLRNLRNLTLRNCDKALIESVKKFNLPNLSLDSHLNPTPILTNKPWIPKFGTTSTGVDEQSSQNAIFSGQFGSEAHLKASIGQADVDLVRGELRKCRDNDLPTVSMSLVCWRAMAEYARQDFLLLLKEHSYSDVFCGDEDLVFFPPYAALPSPPGCHSYLGKDSFGGGGEGNISINVLEGAVSAVEMIGSSSSGGATNASLDPSLPTDAGNKREGPLVEKLETKDINASAWGICQGDCPVFALKYPSPAQGSGFNWTVDEQNRVILVVRGEVDFGRGKSVKIKLEIRLVACNESSLCVKVDMVDGTLEENNDKYWLEQIVVQLSVKPVGSVTSLHLETRGDPLVLSKATVTTPFEYRRMHIDELTTELAMTLGAEPTIDPKASVNWKSELVKWPKGYQFDDVILSDSNALNLNHCSGVLKLERKHELLRQVASILSGSLTFDQELGMMKNCISGDGLGMKRRQEIHFVSDGPMTVPDLEISVFAQAKIQKKSRLTYGAIRLLCSTGNERVWRVPS